jgi:hypothetical protein
MFSSEIERLVHHFRALEKQFLGVFASDEIKRIPFRKNSFAICNSEDSTSVGTHWFLLCRLRKFSFEVIFFVTKVVHKINPNNLLL